ncbi:MAG: type III secretion system chaperone [Kiritimatiellae bacterium]|nr:type III secretion system chaperone [Kiritimatiellia bacterium]
MADFSAKTGLDLVPDERQGCFLENEGIVITIQYRQEADEIVIFAPVTDPDSGTAPTKAMFEKALSLSYDG